ncbi:MAG TPA: polyamine aminopropyltransferase [Anaerolineales bacterium]|nr:polyamine aminopropyltransferase [Anaerolineales bacterium]HMV96327.1 polyamine aminopropyltransferase [Anaerolineales bacterium]HMX19391.1 polyamine aminopropyltransferase [Anaerolineales bacterium]HMX73733.1 polyamine aminopropyltransferase [Anaerolineales bacterium]HMZ42354.1 polyamine aminopropyltransferase [Anaerolineales bacterium]
MSIWFTEELHPYYRKGIRIKNILADEQTPFQHVQVVETEFFGKAMILDGIIQLTERDNMGYHEMIVHVPMLAVGQPKRVLIVGGGDGGSLQQVLRYPSVEEAIVCELDQRVVDLSREHFASFGDPWADPRARLLVRDAFGYLEENPSQFDVIISDTTDPIGMAERLFSEEFYKLMVRALTPNGAAATQCEQPFFDTELIKQIHHSAKTLTKNPAYYYANIPTYPGGGIGFMYVSNTPWENGLKTPFPPGKNQYINPEIHKAAFALPEFFRRELMG